MHRIAVDKIIKKTESLERNQIKRSPPRVRIALYGL